MKQQHKHAAVIHAFADGAQVQSRHGVHADWTDSKYPDFDPACEYRIKPEPPKSYVTQLSFSDAAPNVDYSKLKSVSIGGIEFVPADMLEKVAKAVAEACRPKIYGGGGNSTYHGSVVAYSGGGAGGGSGYVPPDIPAILKRVKEQS